ncbi:MAG: D-2-hydroxyacid dehydrogenase [Clostridia bacterium]|nr:D-2-hydroxyacid dehydrogenase [Clostridia bacterium]
MIRVLVTDGMDKNAIEQLKKQGYEVSEQFYPSEELGAAMAQYDALVVRSATKVRSCHIDAAKGSALKLIIRGGVGIDNIDAQYAEANGIAVRNTPKASSRSVAELALGHILSCCRFISAAGHSMREDKWEKKAYAHGMELAGKTVGIVGFGRIGRCLGRMCQALGMEVIAYDLYPDPAVEETLGIRYVSMEELLAQAHIISIHAPSADGQPIVRAETIAKMREHVIIINTSRGNNVDEQALLEGLNSGKVWAAGLDVYLQEPTPNHDLYSHPRVSCTPHIGAQTDEAQQKVGAEVIEVLNGFFKK